MPVIVKLYLRLRKVKINGPASSSPATEQYSQLMHLDQHIRYIRILPDQLPVMIGYYPVHVGIRHLMV